MWHLENGKSWEASELLRKNVPKDRRGNSQRGGRMVQIIFHSLQTRAILFKRTGLGSNENKSMIIQLCQLPIWQTLWWVIKPFLYSVDGPLLPLMRNLWVCSIFKAKKEEGQPDSHLFCMWPKLFESTPNNINPIPWLLDLNLPKRNFLIYIEHIFSFKMSATLISWICMGFRVTFHIQITPAHRDKAKTLLWGMLKSPGRLYLEQWT